MVAAGTPIIDTHIHIFDTTRPQGVPWPEKTNSVLYKPATPDRYRSIAVPLGITGAIVVEASPWLEDNQWVLDVAAKNPIILGVVGNLEPGKPEFAKQLERFHRNPLFRGIRYGNLWNRSLAAEMAKPQFVADLKLLSKAGLSLDTANPDPELIGAVLRVTDRVPDLRVIIDHLPQMKEKAHGRDLEELGKRPKVYVKLSEVFRRIDGQVPKDLELYRQHWIRYIQHSAKIECCMGATGRTAITGNLILRCCGWSRSIFHQRPGGRREVFFKNSIAAYRWKTRA